MTTMRWLKGLILVAFVCVPAVAFASGLAVELWTDHANNGVYEPGDAISIRARLSEDAFLLVYEIDAEGGVHVIYPPEGRTGPVTGGQVVDLPGDDQNELVVDSQTGEGFVVAIASRAPLDNLPWYLRPFNPQGEGVGYVGKPEEEEGITEDGKIVGDPFVAMERIRRRVVPDANDPDNFATTYVTYYVHEQVRYPRYLCYDCHRPGHYAWWDGFDPYYTTCSAFDFHVNWSWYWGPRYWFGSVPYFVFVYRDGCPPAYRHPYSPGAAWYSSWDGWRRWCDNWGTGGLQRYKSPPPPSYTPPALYRDAINGGRPIRDVPPGFLAGGGVVKPGGIRTIVPVGRSYRGGADPAVPRMRDLGRDARGSNRGWSISDFQRRRQPLPGDGGMRRSGDTSAPREERGVSRGSGGVERTPVSQPPPREERGGGGFERRREEAPRQQAPPPRVERAREDHPAPPPRQEGGGASRDASSGRTGGGSGREFGGGGGGRRAR